MYRLRWYAVRSASGCVLPILIISSSFSQFILYFIIVIFKYILDDRASVHLNQLAKRYSHVCNFVHAFYNESAIPSHICTQYNVWSDISNSLFGEILADQIWWNCVLLYTIEFFLIQNADIECQFILAEYKLNIVSDPFSVRNFVQITDCVLVISGPEKKFYD